MLPATPVLRTRLLPPRLRHRVLRRPGLAARLAEAFDHRLTLVQAGTGYGKSTALASLFEHAGPPSAWYSLAEADAEPQRFLAYLIEAFRLRLPGLADAPLALLEEAGRGGMAAWLGLIEALANALVDAVPGPALLILDDYHFVAEAATINALTEHFTGCLPPDLHLVVATRSPLTSPALTAWRAKGEVLDITREDLAFQPAEIEALYRDTYGLALPPEEVALLAHQTEGWPIALQLVWQGLRHGQARSPADLLRARPDTASASLGTLFDYLAHDVLDRQAPEIAAFLRATAVLHELTPEACDAVTGGAEGAACLQRLHEHDLFVVALGDGHFRYHHLFHDFLRAQARRDPAGERERHRRAADFFHARGEAEEAIGHYLAAEAFAEAAGVMDTAGEAALRAGQIDTVARWIDALPAEVLANQPRLQTYLGDVYRLRSRFEAALAWYAQAERTWRAQGDAAGVSRALRGQALVYLDTVRPAQAQHLLEEALRLAEGTADRQARARMLELLAENKLNMGKPAEAEALRASARALRDEGPHEDVLSVRVKLRTGRLDEAQRVLEGWVAAERQEVALGQSHPPRGHRESVLILSLIHAFRGQAEQAYALAHEGIALSQQLSSPFIAAVGHVRLGHAWQLRRGPAGAAGQAWDEAIRCYQAAVALGDQLAVRRIRAEAMWGLTRAYGFSGDVEAAARVSAEGLAVARWAGDQWIGALCELMSGASLVLAGRGPEAIASLTRVLAAFRECGDSLGRAAARLWLSLVYFETGQGERFAASMDDLLGLCEAHGYGFLFTARSLLGPPDPRRLVPLLIAARARSHRPGVARQLLTDLGLPAVQLHPGYQLRVQTLGGFRVWRGEAEMEAREWRRDKARQLFQLLLAHRGRPLQREAITETLWPALSPEAANRDFKVALNALTRALEPTRSPEAPSAYMGREGSTYFVRPEADVWLDTAEFVRAAEAGLAQAEAGQPDAALEWLRAALQAYGGDFLPEALYDDWASEARERLLALYLRAADRLAGLLIQAGHCDEGVTTCQLILERDPCWEHAYRLMMLAHERQGNRAQALRVYQRCCSVLRQELAVEPSPATTALYARLAASAEPPVTGA